MLGLAECGRVTSGSNVMSTWFTESPTWAYFLLGAAAVVCTFRYIVTRQGKYLWGLPAAALLAAGFWLIDYLVETDREQVERKTQELAHAAEIGDLTRLMDLFSADFSSGAFPSREVLLAEARKYVPPMQSRSIEFWNPDIRFSSNKLTITCRCNAKAAGRFGPWTQNPPHLGVLELTFRKDSDGQWRIRQFRVFDTGGSEVNLPR
jgi:hypothetical protein